MPNAAWPVKLIIIDEPTDKCVAERLVVFAGKCVFVESLRFVPRDNGRWQICCCRRAKRNIVVAVAEISAVAHVCVPDVLAPASGAINLRHILRYSLFILCYFSSLCCNSRCRHIGITCAICQNRHSQYLLDRALDRSTTDRILIYNLPHQVSFISDTPDF